MRVTVTEAKGQLTKLVRRAEAGEEVVLTRHGHDTVKMISAADAPRAASRAAILKEVRAAAAKRKRKRGPSAARSQDFLYDEYGLPK